MMDGAVLLQMNMSFNPFRSTTSIHQHDEPSSNATPQYQNQTSTADSHSNTHLGSTNSNNNSQPSYRSSTALSWIQSWTTLSSTTASSSTVVQVPSQLRSSPAISQIMNRGFVVSHTKNNEHIQSSQTIHNNNKDNVDNDNNFNSIPSLPLHNQKGGIDAQQQHNNDLPPYPESKRVESTPTTRTVDNKSLLEDFPSSTTTRILIADNKSLLEDFPSQPSDRKRQMLSSTATAAAAAAAAAATTTTTTPNIRTIISQQKKKEETTFAGFTLYQIAKSQYCQGKYSQALDTTTDCLVLQRVALNNNAATSSSISSSSSSEKPKSPIILSMEQQQTQHNVQFANAAEKMISQYPKHECVAQTLLLRGHVLAACAYHDNDDDNNDDLLVQAVKHVEMSVAMLRKLSIVDEELAEVLIYLGHLKSELGHYHDANNIYAEGICILKRVRSYVKPGHSYATHNEVDAGECGQYLQRITNGLAHALYLHGKTYHCQRMHNQAFDCYNQAFRLRKDTRLDLKNIIRCMKNRYALEKLVSSYWEDTDVI